MQGPHELGDSRSVVPPVNVIQIDVRRAETLERQFNVEMQRLEAVAVVKMFLFDSRILQVWVIRVLDRARGKIGQE